MRHEINLITIVVVHATAAAQSQPPQIDTAPDKSAYYLFNPTPRDLWRPLSADRPDATESPITVDAGAIQLEASFAEFGSDRESGDTSTSLSVAPINLKIGITNSVDLHLLFNPWERNDSPGTSPNSGLGNLGIRAKINLWGNDGGRTSLAILPYAVFPTGDAKAAGDAYEFGLVVPFAVDLSDGWSLGMQAEIAFVSESGATDTATLAHTAVLGHGIAGNLAGYIEYIGEYAFHGEAEYHPSVSAGLTYALDPNNQLDIGIVVGLDNGDTQDLRVFAGFTKRF